MNRNAPPALRGRYKDTQTQDDMTALFDHQKGPKHVERRAKDGSTRRAKLDFDEDGNYVLYRFRNGAWEEWATLATWET